MSPFFSQAPGVINSRAPEIMVSTRMNEEAPENNHAQGLWHRKGEEAEGSLSATRSRPTGLPPVQTSSPTEKNEMTSSRWRASSGQAEPSHLANGLAEYQPK